MKTIGRTQEKARELGDKFVCLGCEKQVDPSEEQYRRGLCEPCYSEVDRLKNARKLTYDSLVEAGLMLSAKKGGRPRSTERKPSVFAAFVRLHSEGVTAAKKAAKAPKK